jgi:bifunctional UDP-N-acetylglucosamine pyrophosphorylase/glucosamine-1-phosphate N-acetyltransferase
MNLTVVILAAGKGARMGSSLPKVLQPLAGKPLVNHVIDTATRLHPAEIRLVYGHGAASMKRALADKKLVWCLQEEQQGTGHAVSQAMAGIADENIVLVLYGDVPLVREETLTRLIATTRGGALALLTVIAGDPSGYGRIIRNPDTGAVERIVEHQDANPQEATVKEVNTGILAVRAGPLRCWLNALNNDNAQGEYYLTDVVTVAVKEGLPVVTTHPSEEQEVMGVNDQLQRAALERHYQCARANELMRAGVMIMDPTRFDVRRGRLNHGQDVVIDTNVIIEGHVTVGDRVRIGAHVILKNCTLGDDTQIEANSLIEHATVGRGCRIGPYARLRPGSRLDDHVHVGNFVEIKRSTVANGSKVNHLSYIGDAEIGRNCNIGAGTITCNYDGANKHRTQIGDDVFVGSNAALVAPITVGNSASIGAGSVLSREVPAGQLTLARPKAITVANWIRPRKTKTQN